jgi:hypothetical protein
MRNWLAAPEIFMKRVTVAVILSTVTASPVLADPGCIYTDSYLFTNPSYLGGLIGTIPAPAPVEVVRKGKKWSIVSYDGESGYVKTSHLSPRSGARADPPPVVYDQSIAGAYPAFSSGPNSFLGFTSNWTSRTNWSRESSIPADDPSWSACGGR